MRPNRCPPSSHGSDAKLSVLRDILKSPNLGNLDSRSEATAFLINEGIKSKQEMFDKISEKISQIQNLRTELGVMIAEDTKPSET